MEPRNTPRNTPASAVGDNTPAVYSWQFVKEHVKNGMRFWRWFDGRYFHDELAPVSARCLMGDN